MSSKRKNYKVTITAKAPVFVGDGNTLKKKEFVFFKGASGTEIGIVDFKKLYDVAIKKHKQDLVESYFMSPMSKDLDKLFTSLQLTIPERKQCCKYVLSCSLSNGVLGEKEHDISTFIKDPYGCPYVPGSTIKGLIRTALINSEIRKNPNRFSQSAKDIKCSDSKGKSMLAREASSLEKKILEETIDGDVKYVKKYMSGLIIGDSLPLSIEQLILKQKIDVKRNGDENALPILRECLNVGTNIIFNLSIDSELCKYTIEDIEAALYDMTAGYRDNYLVEFTEDIGKVNDGRFFLGGGVGFHNKTVIMSLFNKREALQMTSKILDSQFRKHNHKKDLDMCASPRIVKCTLCKGKTGMLRVKMGTCSFAYEEI